MALAREFVTLRLPALESADYRRLFLTGFFTAGARWAMVLARGWLVFDLTGWAAWVGAVTFASMIPFVFAGPVAGAIADRVDRRRLLIAGTALAIAPSALLVVLVLTDTVQVWHVVALALVSGIAQAITVPPTQALVANVVPSAHLLNAIALSSIAQHGSRIIGPLFGAALLASLDTGSVFALSTVMLTGSLVAVLRLTIRRASAAGDLSATRVLRVVGADLREAIAYVESDRRVATVIVLVSLHCGLTMAFDSMMPTLATMVGGASQTYSGILVGIGSGALIGTFALSMVRAPRVQGRALAVAGFGSGIAMAFLAIASTPALVVLAAVGTGATQASYMALSATYIQEIVPDAMRGRVMAFYVCMAAGNMSFLNLGFGWASEIVGVRPLLLFSALLWLVVFVIAALGLRDIRHLLRRGSFLAPVEATAGAAAGS
ncbi:MAG: MFS transporter [Dehalococcoidia bacterium]